MFQNASLIFVLMAGEVAHVNGLAQSHPVVLTLKGVAFGESTGADGYATDVQVMDNCAYLAWSGDTNHAGGLEIFDITNPAAPVRIGGCESSAPVNAVHLASGYAYLALNTAKGFVNDRGALEIVDVRDPRNPIRLNSIDTVGRANDIHVAGNYAYIPESMRWTGSNLLGGLEIFDVSTPTNPVRVAAFGTVGSATSVDVSGSYAFLADGFTDLQVLDVSSPGNPQVIGIFISDVSQNHCGFENGGPANLITVQGNLAYSAGENGVHVLDVSEPSNPRSVGDNYCFPSFGFQVAGRYAFSMLWSQTQDAFQLRILDAADPANLVGIGRQDYWYSAFCVVDRLVYSAVGNLLIVYEISNAPSIKSISRSGNTLILTWNPVPGFRLQQTDSLEDPAWSDVLDSGGQSQAEVPVTASNRFFRLARP